MDVTLLYDTVSVATTAQVLGFSNLPILNHHLTSATNQVSVADKSQPSLQISAFIFPVDAVAPPRVRSSSYKTATRTLLRKKRRTRRRSSSGDNSNDGDEDGGFFGGGGWNFDRFGGHNWDDSSSSRSDPAIDFFYEVMGWIALSNCVHFAFKRVVRIVAEGLGDEEREGAYEIGLSLLIRLFFLDLGEDGLNSVPPIEQSLLCDT